MTNIEYRLTPRGERVRDVALGLLAIGVFLAALGVGLLLLAGWWS